MTERLDRAGEFAVVPAARREDVASPEAAMRALYDAISGPRGVERDWDRVRSLFDPRARFLIGRWFDEPGRPRDVVYEWDLDGFFVEGRAHWLEHGFWERELAARVERFGNVAHVFSSYESRIGSADSEPVVRGVNSVQLVRHGGRWWIVGIVWDLETDERPLPSDLLRDAGG